MSGNGLVLFQRLMYEYFADGTSVCIVVPWLNTLMVIQILFTKSYTMNGCLGKAHNLESICNMLLLTHYYAGG